MLFYVFLYVSSYQNATYGFRFKSKVAYHFFWICQHAQSNPQLYKVNFTKFLHLIACANTVTRHTHFKRFIHVQCLCFLYFNMLYKNNIKLKWLVLVFKYKYMFWFHLPTHSSMQRLLFWSSSAVCWSSAFQLWNSGSMLPPCGQNN